MPILTVVDIIEQLIPTEVLHAVELRRFMLDLLRSFETTWHQLQSIHFPDWPHHSLSQSQLIEIQKDIRKKKKLVDWPVPAYLVTLSLARSSAAYSAEYHWAVNNLYIFLMLKRIGDHENKILILCTRFRLAQTSKKHAWLWSVLPKISIDKNTLNELFKVQKSIEKEDPIYSRLPADASERFAEIELAYKTAILSKSKISRTRSAKSPVSIRTSFITNNEFARIDEITFPDPDHIKGVDAQEQLYDQKSTVYVDNCFQPEPGTEGSAALQEKTICMQAAHIKRSNFEFPTDPQMMTLASCQQIFKSLWDGYQNENVIDTCLLLSLLTSTSAEIWLDQNIFLTTRFFHKRKSGQKSAHISWVVELDITSQNINEIKPFKVNQLKRFTLPLPDRAIQILKQNQPKTIALLNLRIQELRKQLKIPLLSLSRLQNILHHLIRRHTADHLMADLICSITPKHSPGLYYSSFPVFKLRETYQETIQLIANGIDVFNLAGIDYLDQKVNFDCGSQITINQSLVKIFFNHLHDRVVNPDNHFTQFNAYALWMWHICLLLTSCRPVNHAPGMWKQLDLEAKLIWISDKENRETSSNGRFIPLCDFLCQALTDYRIYLKRFYNQYKYISNDTFGLLNELSFNEQPIIYLLDHANNEERSRPQSDLHKGFILKPITPGLVKTKLKDLFPINLNWERHYGRFYLTKQVKPHLIDAIFGHEIPEHEALHPYSSVSFNELKSVAPVYDQMAIDLELKRIKLHDI